MPGVLLTTAMLAALVGAGIAQPVWPQPAGHTLTASMQTTARPEMPGKTARPADVHTRYAVGSISKQFRQPDIKRPFGVLGYPWPPGLFTFAGIGVTAGAVVTALLSAVYGIALILTGSPIYVVFMRAAKSNGMSKS
jgi:hypothetical protein